MYPESYPKRMPPKAAKAQRRYPWVVTGASTRLKSPVPRLDDGAQRPIV
jgi:hypothetical protein